jgi:hypothetical protein
MGGYLLRKRVNGFIAFGCELCIAGLFLEKKKLSV